MNISTPSWSQVFTFLAQVISGNGLAIVAIVSAFGVLLYSTVQNNVNGFDALRVELHGYAVQQQAVAAKMSELERTQEGIKDIAAQHEMTSQAILWVLIQTCANEAQSDLDRRNCFSKPGPR